MIYNMQKIIKGVYCLTFPNGKRYVGVGTSCKGIYGRWDNYKNLKCKGQPKLYNALKKYGPENVKFEVILETEDKDNALRSEMYLIDIWKLQDIEYGYNINDGGKGNNGYKHSPERIQKIIVNLKKRKWSDSQRQKFKESGGGNYMKGKHHSNITKELMSKQRKGVPKSEETKKKMGLANKGRKYSPETILKMVMNKKHTVRKIKNIQTGEELQGYKFELQKKVGFNLCNLIKKGKAKDWILIDG